MSQLGFYCRDRHHDQKQLREDRVCFSLQLPGHTWESHTQRGARTGAQGKSWFAAYGLLIFFLMQPRTINPGIAFPTANWVPYINHQLKKCPTIYLHVIGWRHSHNQGFSSEITVICVKLTKELTRAVGSFRIPHISLNSLAFCLGLVSCQDSLWSAQSILPRTRLSLFLLFCTWPPHLMLCPNL